MHNILIVRSSHASIKQVDYDIKTKAYAGTCLKVTNIHLVSVGNGCRESLNILSCFRSATKRLPFVAGKQWESGEWYETRTCMLRRKLNTNRRDKYLFNLWLSRSKSISQHYFAFALFAHEISSQKYPLVRCVFRFLSWRFVWFWWTIWNSTIGSEINTNSESPQVRSEQLTSSRCSRTADGSLGKWIPTSKL